MKNAVIQNILLKSRKIKKFGEDWELVARGYYENLIP